MSADLSEGVIQPAAEQGDETPRARYLISDLCAELEAYLTPEQVREVYRAYVFGAEAHEGQKRMSGEPYIYHPVAVARILSQMKMDHKCLMAAILHDGHCCHIEHMCNSICSKHPLGNQLHDSPQF